MKPQFTAIADHALLVTFSETVNADGHASIVAFDRAIADANPPGVIEVVPALVNVLVSFDPLLTSHEQLTLVLQELLACEKTAAARHSQRIVQVCYEEPYAEDLDAVASACNLSREAVINAHLASDYQVLMYGFVPGFAYMTGVNKNIQVPRKPSAVRDRAAGSVIIADSQCLVTTIVMPTGWSIIGRSPTQILFENEDRPFLFDVGDRVTFQRIDLQTFLTCSGHTVDE